MVKNKIIKFMEGDKWDYFTWGCCTSSSVLMVPFTSDSFRVVSRVGLLSSSENSKENCSNI